MRYFIFTALIFLIACSTVPTPRKDASIIIDPDYCELAENNLLKLHCPEGEPTKRGTSFTEVCKQVQNNGVGLNAKCLSTIHSCLDIDKCINL